MITNSAEQISAREKVRYYERATNSESKAFIKHADK